MRNNALTKIGSIFTAFIFLASNITYAAPLQKSSLRPVLQYSKTGKESIGKNFSSKQTVHINPFLLFDPGSDKGNTVIDENTVVFADGGGDCSGLNPAKGYLIPKLNNLGLHSVGIQHGYDGMVSEDLEKRKVELTSEIADVMKILPSTILRSCRRKLSTQDMDLIIDRFKDARAVIISGGNDHIKNAYMLHKRAEERGIKMLIVCMPKSVDNDFMTAMLGFSSALESGRQITARASIDPEKGDNNTAAVFEVMGRKSGSLALECSKACPYRRAVILPEKPVKIADIVEAGKLGARNFFVSEGFSLSENDPDLDELFKAIPSLKERYEKAKRSPDRDPNGNPKLKGASLFVKGILEHFRKLKIEKTDLYYELRDAPIVEFDRHLAKYFSQKAEELISNNETGFFALTYPLSYEDLGPDAVIAETNGEKVYAPRDLADTMNDKKLAELGVLGIKRYDFPSEIPSISIDREDKTMEQAARDLFTRICISMRTHSPTVSCTEFNAPSDVIVSACGKRPVDFEDFSDELKILHDAVKESILVLIPESRVSFAEIATRLKDIYDRLGFVNIAISSDFVLSENDELVAKVLEDNPSLKARFEEEKIYVDKDKGLARFDSGVSDFIDGLVRELKIKSRVTNLGYALKGLTREKTPSILNDKILLARQGVIKSRSEAGLTSDAQSAITFLIKARDQEYQKAVGSKGTAKISVPGEFEFAPGRDILQALRKDKKAVIAVNIVSYNQIGGHLRAAMENNAAIILEVARSQLGYALDEDQVIKYVRDTVKRLNCGIPIVIHGDHIQYTQKLFDQNTILKEEYERYYGKGSFKKDIDIDKIDASVIKAVRDRLSKNAETERKVIADINERLIKAGFTSIAIDASTLYDEIASEAVLDYYSRYGDPAEKLVVELEREFALPLEWGVGILTSDPEAQKSQLEKIKNKIIADMKKRHRPDWEIDIRIKELENTFGVLIKKAHEKGINAQSVIDAYEGIMEEAAGATIAGSISDDIFKAMSDNKKVLLLPTSNVEETAYQVANIKILLEKYRPELVGRFGIEVEVGHVDKKVPNLKRGGVLEAKMTHPAAVKVMGDYLDSAGLSFDLIATNNGSSHGTDFDKKTLTPVSQVGKISPFLTRELQAVAASFGASIAQHGTSGSDMEELEELAEAGVIKFNIATNYQQIIINVLSLLDDGIKGDDLLERAEIDEDALVNGLHEKTRAKMMRLARKIKSDQEIKEDDSLFNKFIKKTYAWGLKKGKIKESSGAEDIATVFAKEFKRVFVEMDSDFYKLGVETLEQNLDMHSAKAVASTI